MTETRIKPAAPKRPRARPAAKPTKPQVAAVKPGRYSEPAPPPIDVEAFRQTVITRRSVRRFTDKAIPPAVLEDCLDMAMLRKLNKCTIGLSPLFLFLYMENQCT